MMRLKVSVFLLVGCCVVIFLLSSLPNTHTTPEAGLGFTLDSSIKHVGEYLVLGLLASNVFYLSAKSVNAGLITALMFFFFFKKIKNGKRKKKEEEKKKSGVVKKKKRTPRKKPQNFCFLIPAKVQ